MKSKYWFVMKEDLVSPKLKGARRLVARAYFDNNYYFIEVTNTKLADERNQSQNPKVLVH